jgi:glycosyltransferase involved in cell wall biosynthesis
MQIPAAGGPHIALNAHLLSNQDSYRSAGVHQYIYHLLCHLGQTDEGLHYTALLGEGHIPPDAKIATQRSRWSTGKPSARILWEQLIQPQVLRQLKADLLHAPVFVGPLFAPCPMVVTIHDLSFIRFPELFRATNRIYLTVMTRLSARRARRLIAVSAHAASESAELLGVPRDRIDVVYHGVDPRFRPLPDDTIAAFRQEQEVPEQFVLFVGTLEPRKNLSRLMEAFARVQDKQTMLVLVGGKGWLYNDLFAKVEDLGLENNVVFTGYVPNEDLPLWYNAATVLAYPSLYEGFGLPVLEAQACGTPVLTSNVSSLPEAAGDAGMLVDPYHVEAIAEGLNELLANQKQRRRLREQGLAHAQGYTWAHTARETAHVYRKALSTHSKGGRG